MEDYGKFNVSRLTNNNNENQNLQQSIKKVDISPFINPKTNSSSNLSNCSFSKNFKEIADKQQMIMNKIESVKKNFPLMTLDYVFLKKNYKIIQAKSKREKSTKNNHLVNLFEIQNFRADSEEIWAVRISNKGEYMATGGKSGVLKIWEIISYTDSILDYKPERGLSDYLNYINETAFRIYTEHQKDIIDICWSKKDKNQLLTASFDYTVLLWDITKDSSIARFEHKTMVTCITYHPSDEYVCLLFNFFQLDN